VRFKQWLTTNGQQATVTSGLAVIATHLVASSLLRIDAPWGERLVWATAAVVALASAAFVYGRLRRAARALALLAVGLPALMFGLGIHASHVIQVGLAWDDVTGIPMLVAGLFLTIAGAFLLVKAIRTWWRRLLLIPAALAITIFFIFPVTLAIFATNVAHVPCCDETPADRGIAYEDVSFETEQHRRLSAWFIAPENGAVVITAHGAGSNRTTVMDEAEMLVSNGYGVLMLDLEGFGDSQGRANAFGWAGARDVAAAVEYLKTREEVEQGRVGGLGLSMGGEVLLQAAAETPNLTAIVSEGVSARTRDDLDERDGLGRVFIFPFWEVVETSIQVLTGESVPPPLKDMVRQIGQRPVLLIAANTAEEREFGALYLEEGGPSFELWTIPEAKHVGAFDLHTDEYERRVIAFFDEALLGDAPLSDSR